MVPPWLAEGVAQYMYENADWDHWDSHRDMILRDRAIHGKLLSFTEMNTFGKKGIGNESTYNSGFALSTFIANEYGPEKLKEIMIELSSPIQLLMTFVLFPSPSTLLFRVQILKIYLSSFQHPL